jgi:hypothetical protein
VEDARAQVLERRGCGRLGERSFRIGSGWGLEILLAGGENKQSGDGDWTTGTTHDETILEVSALRSEYR